MMAGDGEGGRVAKSNLETATAARKAKGVERIEVGGRCKRQRVQNQLWYLVSQSNELTLLHDGRARSVAAARAPNESLSGPELSAEITSK
jgi:hypothetical protein